MEEEQSKFRLALLGTEAPAGDLQPIDQSAEAGMIASEIAGMAGIQPKTFSPGDAVPEELPGEPQSPDQYSALPPMQPPGEGQAPLTDVPQEQGVDYQNEGPATQEPASDKVKKSKELEDPQNG